MLRVNAQQYRSFSYHYQGSADDENNLNIADDGNSSKMTLLMRKRIKSADYENSFKKSLLMRKRMKSTDDVPSEG